MKIDSHYIDDDNAKYKGLAMKKFLHGVNIGKLLKFWFLYFATFTADRW